MFKGSKTAFLLTVLAMVMGLGGWNFLAAELLFRVFEALPKESPMTKSHHGETNSGEKSAGSTPSVRPGSSEDQDNKSDEEDLDADEIDTMYAQHQIKARHGCMNLSLSPGTPLLSPDSRSFSLGRKGTIGERV